MKICLTREQGGKFVKNWAIGEVVLHTNVNDENGLKTWFALNYSNPVYATACLFMRRVLTCAPGSSSPQMPVRRRTWLSEREEASAEVESKISLKVEVGSVRLSKAGLKVPETPASDAL